MLILAIWEEKMLSLRGYLDVIIHSIPVKDGRLFLDIDWHVSLSLLNCDHVRIDPVWGGFLDVLLCCLDLGGLATLEKQHLAFRLLGTDVFRAEKVEGAKCDNHSPENAKISIITVSVKP
jgi:hypothetical protein